MEMLDLLKCQEGELAKYCFENITKSSNNPSVDRKSHTLIMQSLFGLKETTEITLDTPLKILWKITGRCNANCKHCWAKLGFDHSHEALMKLADEICENNVLMVSISGGEPFLREDIFDILEKLKSNNILIDIMTNGSLIDEKVVCRLKNILNIDTDVVQISLDGPNSEIHDSQRNTKIFDKAVNAIQLLKQHNIKVRNVFTATPINQHYILETYKLANSLGVDTFAPAPVFPLRRGKNFENKLDDMVYIRQVATCKQIEDKMKTKLRIQVGQKYQYLINKYYDKLNTDIFDSRESRIVCLNETNAFMQIDSEGDALPGPEWEKEAAAGNVYEEGLMNVWKKGNKWKEFRKNRDLTKCFCNECKIFNICRGGHAKYAYDAYGTINMPDATCIIAKENDDL